ncbi:MAG: ATP-binding protein [Caldilineaceae bacterium]
MKIHRFLQQQILDTLLPGKVIVLYGPRQVGKTTLVHDLISVIDRRTRFVNADELLYREALASQNRQQLDEVLADAEILFIDEAQRVSDIGLNLKILIDNHPDVTILATGSASFELANKIDEPLTGRKITFNLYPVSYPEIRQTIGVLEARSQLEQWLIWGGYPEIVTSPAHLRERLLGELVGSYLFRDLLELEGLRRADKLVDLLRLLAFQIGHEVSLTELGTNLAINRQTVERYLDLLEKVFVIYRVGGFARNLRKEITKNARYYFYDNGVRNSLIQNFNPLSLRDDVGQLWENFLMIERIKAHEYAGRQVNRYFWRTYDQKEIDLVEERQGQLFGYEFKWRAGAIKQTTQKEFLSAYPDAHLEVVSRDNLVDFLG